MEDIDRVTKAQEDDLAKRFTYHPPMGDQAARYDEIRAQFLGFAHFLVARTPVSREQSVMLTKLEECMFAANASIARNE